MKLTLLRHGETDGSRRDLYYGAADIPALPESLAALHENAAAYPRAKRYYTSGLLRTEQTLEAIYGPVAHQQLPGLQEMNFGDFEMKSYQELKDTAAYQAWITDVEHNVCPNGESAPQVLERNRGRHGSGAGVGGGRRVRGPRRRHGGADDDLVRRRAVRLLREARHRVHGDVPGREACFL